MLATDLAMELTETEFLVKFDNDGFFVVAEEAGESCRKGFALQDRWVSGDDLTDFSLRGSSVPS